MARKNLLTESELHRFMKLAEIRPIGEDKLQEMGYGDAPALRDEEEDEQESKSNAEDSDVTESS